MFVERKRVRECYGVNNSKEKVRQIQNKLYLTVQKCDAKDFMRFMIKCIGMIYFPKHGNE